ERQRGRGDAQAAKVQYVAGVARRSDVHVHVTVVAHRRVEAIPGAETGHAIEIERPRPVGGRTIAVRVEQRVDKRLRDDNIGNTDLLWSVRLDPVGIA